MKAVPVARFAVPTGTAAATVVMRESTGDDATDARRFGALSALGDEAFRGAFEELIVEGIYTVLAQRVLVLRVSRNGTRAYGAVVAIDGAGTEPPARAGLASHPTLIATDTSAPSAADFRALLEAEAKQRPVFHGMTPEGITYSGFEAQSGAAILGAIAALAPANAPTASIAVVFAGDTVELPDGLVVGLHTAPV